jgi:hypothetical protein
MNKALIFEFATGRVITQREDALFLGPPTVPLLIVDDLGMRKLPATAAEGVLGVSQRRRDRHPWRAERGQHAACDHRTTTYWVWG